MTSDPCFPAHCAPDALRGGGHWDVGDAERGEGVEDRIHDGRGCSDGAAFADTLGAERVRRTGDRAEIDRDSRQCVSARDGVIQQCAGQELAAVGFVDDKPVNSTTVTAPPLSERRPFIEALVAPKNGNG